MQDCIGSALKGLAALRVKVQHQNVLFTVCLLYFVILTSHAIVGEPLAELIHNDEEDADGVAKHQLILIDKRNSSSEFSN